MRRLALISGVVAVGVLGITAAPASAKSTSTSSAPASLVVNNDPPFGGAVSLTATYGPIGKNIPEESVTCTSNGVEVYLNVQTGSTAGSWTSDWGLWSQTWADAGGGPANCVAQLFYYTWQGKVEIAVTYLASSSFAVT
jgi:hypothetical protein